MGLQSVLNADGVLLSAILSACVRVFALPFFSDRGQNGNRHGIVYGWCRVFVEINYRPSSACAEPFRLTDRTTKESRPSDGGRFVMSVVSI